MIGLPTDGKEATNTVSIFGIPITVCTLDEAITLIEGMIENRQPQLVAIANAHTLNLAYEQEAYRQVLRTADLVLRDGSGMAWAIRRSGGSPLHNFVGTDFIPDFCKYTASKGYKIFLLGSRPGVAQLAATKLKSVALGVVIAGHYHGYFSEEKSDEIVREINERKSDILLVAMGNPKQELWIAKNLHRLNVPVCMGVGALFDYLGGRATRAPQWMLKAGIEWVFRLMVEPKRLWKRYLIGNIRFIMRVYRQDIEGK